MQRVVVALLSIDKIINLSYMYGYGYEYDRYSYRCGRASDVSGLATAAEAVRLHTPIN